MKKDRPACTAASHEALKNDADAWGALPVKPDWHVADRVLQMRDCPHCRSTLAIELPGARAA